LLVSRQTGKAGGCRVRFLLPKSRIAKALESRCLLGLFLASRDNISFHEYLLMALGVIALKNNFDATRSP
jgi:hypothetical protein